MMVGIRNKTRRSEKKVLTASIPVSSLADLPRRQLAVGMSTLSLVTVSTKARSGAKLIGKRVLTVGVSVSNSRLLTLPPSPEYVCSVNMQPVQICRTVGCGVAGMGY
jgi:hypothetical protein